MPESLIKRFAGLFVLAVILGSHPGCGSPASGTSTRVEETTNKMADFMKTQKKTKTKAVARSTPRR